MKFLRNFFDKQKPLFERGGKLEKFYALYEAIDTFLYTPGEVTEDSCHVRDGIDLKRAMATVALALVPCIAMALYNTGYQVNLVLDGTNPGGWRGQIISALGLGFDPNSLVDNSVHGLLYFLPVFLVANAVGGFWEALFAMVRKHEINEGFLVTGMLYPLILPPTIPLWMVAVGISFGVVIGKEVFGGTGKNILNPALTARVFLFFAYPAHLTGNTIWIADGSTAATPLGIAAESGIKAVMDAGYTWMQAFYGFLPGSMGETSALACLIGAAILIITKIGSWRIMASALVGMLGMSSLLYAFSGSGTNMMFTVPPHWHFVLGSFTFAIVFMATDPVSAAMTTTGKYIYGFLIGCMGIIIRSINPAFPEGWMLAILFMNVFAPLIDHAVMSANIKRRMRRNELTA